MALYIYIHLCPVCYLLFTVPVYLPNIPNELTDGLEKGVRRRRAQAVSWLAGSSCMDPMKEHGEQTGGGVRPASQSVTLLTE